MQVNYRIDFFAVFIFLGIVQAVFLLFFFLSKENRKSQVNVFHGLMLISVAACILEIFLMYTGYIIHCLYLVDFSEVFALLIGPFFYLLVISLIRGSVQRKQYWHFVFPAIYLILQFPFLLLPENAKYNAWMFSYHPGFPLREFSADYDPKIFFITDHHTEVTVFSLLFYGVLGLIQVVKAFRSKNEVFWKSTNPVLRTLRFGLLQIISGLVIILMVKLFNKKDLGDHIFAAYISLTIYFTSFSVMRSSGFFKPQSLQDPQKYKSSSLTPEQQESTVRKLKEVMGLEKPFLELNFSLPDLAQRLNVSVHTLSQILNEGIGKGFFEFTAEYRIEEAKTLLKEHPNFKIEEIAERVGYNSKSSFNTAFKKLTGKTPSEYRAIV